MITRVVFIGFLITALFTSCGEKDTKKGNGISYSETPLASPTAAEDARVTYNKGYLAFHNGDLKTAIGYYKGAIAADPKYTDAYDNCGICYRKLGILDSAIYCYKKSIAINPSSMAPYADLAIIYNDEGKFQEALDEYIEMGKYNPNEPEAYYGQAEGYLRLNQPGKALTLAMKSVELFKQYNPDYVGDAEFLVGLAYYQTGDKIKAKEYMTQADQDKHQIPDNYKIELGIK